MPAPSVVVLGSVNVDFLVRVSRLPGPGETVSAAAIDRLPGGKGANQAVAAARAGAATSLVARVGSDSAGRACVEGLIGRGVDVSHVRVSTDTVTGAAFITVDEAGENTIVVVPGANATLSPDDVAASGALVGADVVLLQLEVPIETVVAAAARARTAGARVVLNPSPWRSLPSELLAEVDVIVVNEHERTRLPATGAAAVVTTRGSRGARWDGSGVTIEVAAPCVRAIDTTGAGDAFAGAFAAALAAGAGDQEALERAVAAGADAVTWAGAQGWALPPA